MAEPIRSLDEDMEFQLWEALNRIPNRYIRCGMEFRNWTRDILHYADKCDIPAVLNVTMMRENNYLQYCPKDRDDPDYSRTWNAVSEMDAVYKMAIERKLLTSCRCTKHVDLRGLKPLKRKPEPELV
jgi:hypothetical protein